MKIQLKRSNVLVGSAAKSPSAGQMEYGELAVNYNETDPAIFIKDSNNNIIRIAGADNIADDGTTNVPSGTTPPQNAEAGNLWFNDEEGRLYIYYVDADSSQWVDASPDSWDPSSYPDVGIDTPQSGTLDDRYLMLNAANDPITSNLEVQGNITVSGTVDGRDVAADGAKLDGIETGADVSQWVDVTGGINYPSGNVGIGAPTPISKLHVDSGVSYTFFQSNVDGRDLPDASEAGLGIGWNEPGGSRHINFVNNSNQEGFNGNGGFRFVTHDTKDDTKQLILINGFGDMTTSGSVGIGTTSPAGKLDIKLNASPQKDIIAGLTTGSPMFTYRNGTGSWFHAGKHPTNDAFVFTVGATTTSTELVRIDASGKVGIGTTSPLNTLHVVGSSSSSNTGATILVDSNEALAANIGGSIAFRATDGNEFRTYGLIRGGKLNSGSGAFDGYLAFETRENGETNTTEHMRIDYNGNVGIGTTNPTNKLHILSKDPWGGILIEDSSTSTACPVLEIIGKRNDGNTSPAFSGRVCLAANRGNGPVPVNKILGTVLFGGNHTDGSTSNILYTSSIAGISEGTFSDSNTMPTGIAFYTGDKGRTTEEANVNVGSECMRITSDGNVGIGTTSPRTRLQVTKSDDDIPAVGAPGAAQIGRGSGYGVQIGTQSTGRGYIQAQRSDGTATTYDLLLNPNGDNVGIGTTEPRASLEVRGDDVILAEGLGTSKSTIDIVSDKTSNNGADARPGICFRAPYSNGPDRPTYGAIYALKENSGQGVQNGAIVFATNSGAPGICEEKVRILSNGGITFNGDTAGTNALDDYEEGTWTPSLTAVTAGTSTFTPHSANGGTYTKVGNMVFVSFNLRGAWTGGTSSGLATLAGLPYTIVNRNTSTAPGSSAEFPACVTWIQGVTFSAGSDLYGGIGVPNTTRMHFSTNSNGTAVKLEITAVGAEINMHGSMTYLVT